jgi:hypothetical protein
VHTVLDLEEGLEYLNQRTGGRAVREPVDEARP